MKQTRRERVRQAAIGEIKSIAWETANADGIEQVTINGIARQMGMTPPAFYSYFKSRDDLLRELVIDAYRSFREALLSARAAVPESDGAERLFQVYLAYREWAIENPGMFGLFAGRRVHGFQQQDPGIIAEAEKVYAVFTALYEAAWQQGLIHVAPGNFSPPQLYAKAMSSAIERFQVSFPGEIYHHIVTIALTVHGMISMELSNRFSELAGDMGAFYRFQVIQMLQRIGIQVTPES